MTLPVLPDTPGNLPVERIVDLCLEIYERRDQVVASASLEAAHEALRRAKAIEQYVSQGAQKQAAKRAARVLETAVGAALGPASVGANQHGEALPASNAISRIDRHRFRTMAEHRDLWWPVLEEKPLSRKQVLRIIADANAPRYVGPGDATVFHMPAIEFLAQEGSADLLMTDPPYSTDVDDIGAFVSEWLPAALAALKPSGRAFIFVGAYAPEWAAYCSHPLPDGWSWGVPHAWCYRNAIGPTPEMDFIRNWQCMLTIRGPEAKPMASDRITDLLAGYVENAPDGRQETKLHRWQKPLPLIERLIGVATMPGDKVIDPFAGSGTSLIAARESGRFAFGSDIDPEAVRTCIERGCNAG